MAAKSDLGNNGYAEMKARPLSDCALHPKASAMGFHNMAGNGEAQTGASGFAGTRGIHPIEAFKNSLLLDLRDADTCVSDSDNDAPIRAQGRNLDFPSSGRILQGIIEKILQHLLKAIGISA